ncbi:MAG: hypothetical protein A2089_12670 [Elusimicrobia bacterium GWD2_63_28]|nr:MAG: hypothetical protein A2089_12670 [Elusimicrobia bacterium GWD2_63_28]
MNSEKQDDEWEPAGGIDYRETFCLLFRFVLSEKYSFAAAFAWLILSVAFSLLTPVIARHIIDAAIPSRDMVRLSLAVAGLLLNSLFFLWTNYLLRMRLVETGQRIMRELKKEMLEKLLSLDMRFHSENTVGQLTARVQADPAALYELFTATAVNIFRDVIMFAATFGIMFYFSPRLASLLLALSPLVVAAAAVFLRRSSSLFVDVRRLTGDLSGFLTEHLSAVGVLQCYGREEMAALRLEKLNGRKFSAELKAETMMLLFFLSVILVNPLAVAMTLGVGGRWMLAGEFTLGTLVMFLLYIGKLFDPVFSISEHIGVIQRAFSSGHRIQSLLKLRPAIVDPVSPRPAGSVREGIEFRDVWMRYAPEAPWVLKGVSFTLRKGKALAVVGETGGGKTTLSNLLLRFYEPEKGEILLDGTAISGIKLSSLRGTIGLVPQDVHLFPGTVMQNLKLMDESVPDAKVHAAIAAAGLERFFARHPLRKLIADRGHNLSAGEKQVIALVRALVGEHDVIVFDEATSQLDPRTERLICAAMQRLGRTKTLMLIAHRLSTIRHAEEILVLSGGEIKETGTHADLLCRGGHYAKLHELQHGKEAS